MEIFHKGSDHPPLIFGSYGTGDTHLILVTKKGKNKTFQKHLKWLYLKEVFCKKLWNPLSKIVKVGEVCDIDEC